MKELIKDANQPLNNLNWKPDDDEDALDRILRHVGEMGMYQRILFVAMLPFGFFIAFVYGVQMFVTATPQKHWCKVPELQHLDLELRRNLSIPGAASGTDWDRCTMYNANWTSVLVNLTPPSPETPIVPCQHGWEFLYNDIPYVTIVSERDWVCSRSSYAPTAQAVFFVGSLVGCTLFGWMGDRFGRVPALVGANLIGCLGGVAGIFTIGILDFAFCRFLVGMAQDSAFTMIYLLVIEYVGLKHRTWVSNMSMGLFITAGSVVLPFLALWLLDWRKLLIFTSVPMLIVIAAPWLIPESARWLASTGKVNRAVKVLKKFEKVNKNNIPNDVLEEFIVTSTKKHETDESLKAVLKTVSLRNKLLTLTVVSMITCIVIDAIVRMSEAIGNNFFVTYALSSLAELPALAMVTLVLDKWGRRFVTSGTLLLAGVASLICIFVPQGVPKMIMAILCRFFINMSFGAQIQLGAELLPTAVRATGNSLIHVSVYIATILSPFIVYSSKLWNPMPLTVLGAISLVGSGLALFLPETKGKSMPQTIADSVNIIREGTLFGKSTRKDYDQELKDVSHLKRKLND